ncbi:MAG: hypothetical protein GC168_18655 [Candidatus Hydrogenedens sp.]|nr:hypothetical protein [Candidatus Hydrogenedens sp.]
MSDERIVRCSLEDLQPTKTDWARVDALTDEEIAAAVASDPDAAPLLDEAWFKTAQVVEPPTKELISIRLDKDVLDYFRTTSERYQTRINAILRHYMQHEQSRR